MMMMMAPVRAPAAPPKYSTPPWNRAWGRNHFRRRLRDPWTDCASVWRRPDATPTWRMIGEARRRQWKRNRKPKMKTTYPEHSESLDSSHFCYLAKGCVDVCMREKMEREMGDLFFLLLFNDLTNIFSCYITINPVVARINS